MSNVYDFESARQKRAQQQVEAEEFINVQKLPPEVEIKLNEENEKVLHVLQFINKEMDGYAEKHGKDASVLVPIEALARQMVGMLAHLDAHLKPAVAEDARMFREELGDLIADYVHQYGEHRGTVEGKPVFQHDMYLAILSALCTLIFEHRMSQIHMKAMTEGGKQDEERRTDHEQEVADGGTEPPVQG